MGANRRPTLPGKELGKEWKQKCGEVGRENGSGYNESRQDASPAWHEQRKQMVSAASQAKEHVRNDGRRALMPARTTSRK